MSVFCPAAAEKPAAASGGGGDTSLDISFEEPSKPVRKRPVLSSQKKVREMAYIYAGFCPHWSAVVRSNHHSVFLTTTR